MVLLHGRGARPGLLVTVLAATAVVTACGGGDRSAPASLADVSNDSSGFTGTLLRPPVPRPALVLPDTSSRTFDLRSRPRNELTVLFFGYTNCPDVCPTTMADLAAATRALPGAVRARTTVVFVTEDPKRDTPTVVRAWLDRFDRHFTGLIGGGASTSSVLSQLHLPATALRSPTDDRPEAPGSVEHSGIVYVFGATATLLYTGGATPGQYARDLTRLANLDGRAH
jgi:protein SCO1/2